jgi:hypothetical protein
MALIPGIWLGWWLGSPLFINKTVEEDFPATTSAVASTGNDEQTASGQSVLGSEPVAVYTGNFRDEDRLHRGTGTATVYALDDGSSLLRLEELDVTNGPDLYVLLMNDPEGRDKDLGYVNLGRLKGNRGNQNYEVPSDVNVDDFKAVMIYCQAFHVVFSTAPLMAA